MELPKFENKEQLAVKTKILSTDELIEMIYKGNSLPQDTRFLPFEDGGVFKYFSLRDIASISRFSSKKFFPVVYEEDKVVGLSELEQDPNNIKIFWIKFVSIDPIYQGRKYASKLLRQIFLFAKDYGYTLKSSFYSEQGLEKLKSVVEKLSVEMDVHVIND